MRALSVVALGATLLIGGFARHDAAVDPACEPNNAGLTVPKGFCVTIFADSVGRPRQIVVAPNGDVFVALSNSGRGAQARKGGILGLRDTNRDGKADTRVQSGENGGNGIALRGNYVYFSPDDAVLRYGYRAGELALAPAPDTLVRELPIGGHSAKSVVLGRGNEVLVNIGSATNSCQERDRIEGVKGNDPCTELETRAGIWQFDATKLNQRQADGARYATGLRNTVAMTVGPDGSLYGATHGRDGLTEQWGMDADYGSENPAEIVSRISRGDDYGWPYCFYATAFTPEIKQQVLTPEYGGDGKQVGRCADKKVPLYGFPGHWAPNSLAFYSGTQFPAQYRSGVFIAFHGSWNRKPPQQGYKVVFLPVANGKATGSPQTFADGFSTDQGKMSGRGEHRPTGLAVAPDGSLYVTDDTGGRIYRIFYTGR
jgi:glucose/arabinose dehydrogenase